MKSGSVMVVRSGLNEGMNSLLFMVKSAFADSKLMIPFLGRVPGGGLYDGERGFKSPISVAVRIICNPNSLPIGMKVVRFVVCLLVQDIRLDGWNGPLTYRQRPVRSLPTKTFGSCNFTVHEMRARALNSFHEL